MDFCGSNKLEFIHFDRTAEFFALILSRDIVEVQRVLGEEF
jgi:hypothetical protein